MSKIRKIFLSHPRGYIAGGIISTAMFLLCLFIKNNYKLIGFIDAIGYSFLFTFFVSLLVLVNYWGAFDTLSYGLYYVFNHKSQKYESLSNYRDAKNISRKKSYPFVPYMMVSFVYLIIYLVLYLVFISSI